MAPKLVLDKRHINFFEQGSSKQFILEDLANRLQSSGMVRESFVKAIQEREEVFPTGLPTQPYGVAIPHTDFEHVISNAIAVGLLKEPVEFVEMGSSDGSVVAVNLILMLAVAEKESTIPTLMKIVTIMKNQDFLGKTLETGNSQELFDLLKLEMNEIVICNE